MLNDYIQGWNGIEISGSTSTVVGGSTMVATNSGGVGPWLTGGSVGLTLSISTLMGGLGAAGVFIDQYDSGTIVISTNVFPAGSSGGINVATQTRGHTGLHHVEHHLCHDHQRDLRRRIFFIGTAHRRHRPAEQHLLSRHRRPCQQLVGIYAQSSQGLQIDHNRINEPGLITSGNFIAAEFDNDPNTTFKFNDVNANGAA